MNIFSVTKKSKLNIRAWDPSPNAAAYRWSSTLSAAPKPFEGRNLSLHQSTTLWPSWAPAHRFTLKRERYSTAITDSTFPACRLCISSFLESVFKTLSFFVRWNVGSAQAVLVPYVVKSANACPGSGWPVTILVPRLGIVRF